ncbi:hypothetical protein [Gluconobacter roseus]|uniref:hypothetical protein n=1 Tax=Gluconobacter roseus TaxID=586239 RepID=UPI0038D11751
MDMANLTQRDGLYYVRFIIPKDRWQDAGEVLGSRTGTRKDILKSLQTRTHKDALRLRDAALEAIRKQLNRRLVDAGLAPLHGVDVPDWLDEELMLTEALEARRKIASASDTDDFYDENTGISESPRDRVVEGMDCFLEDRAHKLDHAGKDGARYQTRFREIATGARTPFALVMDRWMKDRESEVGPSAISLDRAAFNLFSRYLAHSQDLEEPEDLMGFLRAQVIEDIPEMVLGGFAEWLLNDQDKAAKTVSCRISSLKGMWSFAIQKHILKGPNPWNGATAGLKRKAGKKKTEVRPFTEDELIRLLSADPDEKRRWAWGPAIRDLMRLALLTGARLNELASLTVGRVLNRDGTEGELWGIQVTDEEAKTKNSIRRIPLHPLVQPIIARRLKEAGEGNTDAPLFPECKPGGTGGKRSHVVSQRFTDFRRDVLGRESDKIVDFHSFRRSFITCSEQANAHGAAACTELVRDHLTGHKPISLAGNTYAAKDLGWDLYSRAVLGVVEKGIPEAVRNAL